MAKSICSRTAILAVLAAIPGLAQSTPAPVGQEAQKAALDSIDQNLDAVEAQARRSLVGGGSKPVSFSGEALFRFIGTEYDDYPSWMTKDVTETKNSVASVRVGMVAAPHRNLRLWSKIGFNSAMMGTGKPAPWGKNGTYFGTPNLGTLDVRANQDYEDMSAGLIAKTGSVTTQTKIGGVLWTEASPLSVWKGQNRMFGWDYVPYELEQSSAQYYEYATIKGEKTGRAAWNKKPFQGIQLESVEMPYNLYYNLTYGYFDMGQKYQPFMINTNTTNGLMATNDYGCGSDVTVPCNRTYGTKGIGIGDTYRHTFLARVAKSELPFAVTAGANYVNYSTDSDYPKQFWMLWSGTGDQDYRPVAAWHKNGVNDSIGKYNSNYFTGYQVVTTDFRRNIPGGLQFHVDIAASNVDTSFFKVDDSGAGGDHWRRYGRSDSATLVNAYKGQVIGHSKSEWTPAVYGMVSYPVALGGKNYEFQFQSIFAPKKFYSGSSFVLPLDAIFPYESNLTGAGKFGGTDNGTPYIANLTGVNLTAKIPVEGGHAKFNWGFHTQLESGANDILLPWRLNGTAFNYSMNASTTRYDGATLLDDFMLGNPPTTSTSDPTKKQLGRYRQIRRFGNEFYNGLNPGTETDLTKRVRRNEYAPLPGLAGGARADFMSTFESFGAFRIRRGTPNFANDSATIENMYSTGEMPIDTKATQNFSFDVAKNIARYWNGKNSFFLGLYGAINSVTKSGSPLPSLASGDKTYLSSYILRFEPVVQVSEKIYLVGLLGHETWNSDYGVAAIDSATGLAPAGVYDAANTKYWHAAPIDYSDWAYGIGVDWDIASRVGLHLRLERFTHEDKGISSEVKTAAGKNDYQAWLLHAETKMWF